MLIITQVGGEVMGDINGQCFKTISGEQQHTIVYARN